MKQGFDSRESIKYRSIATSLPGVRFSELLPCTAAIAHKLCVIRSMSHKHTTHEQAMHAMLSGHALCDGHQIQGAGDHESTKLSGECSAHLSYWAGMEHGLLNVVAECLDHLIVKPGMAEVDEASRPTWWQDWWRRM